MTRLVDPNANPTTGEPYKRCFTLESRRIDPQDRWGREHRAVVLQSLDLECGLRVWQTVGYEAWHENPDDAKSDGFDHGLGYTPLEEKDLAMTREEILPEWARAAVRVGCELKVMEVTLVVPLLSHQCTENETTRCVTDLVVEVDGEPVARYGPFPFTKDARAYRDQLEALLSPPVVENEGHGAWGSASGNGGAVTLRGGDGGGVGVGGTCSDFVVEMRNAIDDALANVDVDADGDKITVKSKTKTIVRGSS